jgi:hypothetical protein
LTFRLRIRTPPSGASAPGGGRWAGSPRCRGSA